MTGQVISKPAQRHNCAPGWTWKDIDPSAPGAPPPEWGTTYGVPPTCGDYPPGTRWLCDDCGTVWVALEPARYVGIVFASGMAPPRWRRESRWERWRRKRAAP